MSTALYYYANEENQPVGPFAKDVLEKLMSAGVILPETLVCPDCVTAPPKELALPGPDQWEKESANMRQGKDETMRVSGPRTTPSVWSPRPPRGRVAPLCRRAHHHGSLEPEFLLPLTAEPGIFGQGKGDPLHGM